MRIVRRRPVRALVGVVALASLSLALPVASGGVPGSRAAAEPPPLRVLVVGDSISQGQTGSATWRYWLWRETVRQGARVELVGPRRWPKHGRTYEHLDDGFGEQTWHAAVAGSRYQRHIDSIAGTIDAYDPDVVLTELGFNDLRVRDRSSARRTAIQAHAYTRAALAADPDLRVVLGEIPSTSRRVGWFRGFAATKNAMAADADARIDRKLARLGSPRVSRADLRSDPRKPWRPRQHTYDGSHPNSTGETLLAEHFADALHDLGHLPRAPQVFHREPWQPRPRFNAKQDRRGAVALWWGKDARRIHADTYVARVLVRGRTRRFTPRRSGAIVVDLPPGRYRVRMVARRGTMTSRPGPVRWVGIT